MRCAVTRQQLREGISQLWRLNEVPRNPKENPLVHGRELQHNISISREKEIASNLAFFSATTNDSPRVLVVCLEERVDGGSQGLGRIKHRRPHCCGRDGCTARSIHVYLRTIARLTCEMAHKEKETKKLDALPLVNENGFRNGSANIVTRASVNGTGTSPLKRKALRRGSFLLFLATFPRREGSCTNEQSAFKRATSIQSVRNTRGKTLA